MPRVKIDKSDGSSLSFSKTKTMELVTSLLILVLLVLLVVTVKNFYIAWNNVDTAYNAISIQNQVNQFCLQNPSSECPYIGEFTDIGSDFNERPIEVYYISAMKNLTGNFLEMMAIAALLGFLLRDKL